MLTIGKSFLGVLLVFLAALYLLPPALGQDNQAELKEIIQTRKLAVQALNTQDFSKVKPYLHPTFTITTVDNKIFSSIPEFDKYWKQQFAGPIKRIEMTLPEDTTRTFLSPETVISHGSALTTFYFTENQKGVMPLRWTAVLQKYQGKWTIQSLHFSSNLLDNPVLEQAQQLGQTLAILAGVGGLVIGGVIVALFKRGSRV